MWHKPESLSDRNRLEASPTSAADALNSLVEARADLISIRNVLSKKTAEEKLKLFKTEKFMAWWIMKSAELIQHWYSIEENISSPVLTKDKNSL